MRSYPLARFLLATTLGCAHDGTRPHDMGAADHAEAAVASDAAATAHAKEYDPGAEQETDRCHTGKGGRVCWTAVTNPTDKHLREAEALRALAEEHRAASAALLAAEASSCAGLAPEDRDISPFAYGEDIASVDAITIQHNVGKASQTDVVGATVTVRAVPGLTAEWLQRVVDCHVARNASLGHSVPEMPDCPLVPIGVSAKVTSAGTGFAVEIRANSDDAARDVLARARRLVAATASE